MNTPTQSEKQQLSEIRIVGVSPSLHDDLRNISRNLGITTTALLKPKLREIADSYEAHMKQPPREF